MFTAVVLAAVAFGGVGDGEVVLSEVLVNEPGSSTKLEWVELHNAGADSVDLDGWLFVDGDNPPDSSLVPSSSSIAPGGFFIIADDTASFLANWNVPADVPVVEIPMTLGNSGDSVAVVDTTGNRRAFRWTNGGSDGVSLEKILPLGGDDDANWSESEDPEGSTPGYRNSLTPLDVDGEVTSIVLDPSRPEPGDDPQVTVEVRNAGATPIPLANVHVVADGDTLLSSSVEDLQPTEVGSVVVTWFDIPPGTHRIEGSIEVEGDQDGANDALEISITVGTAAVVLSEVMANPAGSEDSDEFIEIFNRGDESVDVSGWSVTDGDEVDALMPWDEGIHGVLEADGLVTGSTVIPPGGFAVILDPDYGTGEQPHDLPPGAVVLTVEDNDLGNGLAAQSPNADPLTLYDSGGTGLQDVVDTYGTPIDDPDPLGRDDDGLDEFPRDPGNGYTVERIDPEYPDRDDNWNDSPLGGTPGGRNSETPYDVDLAIESGGIVLRDEVPGGASTVGVTVRNVGKTAVGSALVTLRHIDGADTTEVGQVATGTLESGSEDEVLVTWDPYPGGAPVVEAMLSLEEDENPANNQATRRFGLVVVINEVLSNPEGLESDIPGGASDEWIELFNASSDAIDLDGWMLSDGDGVDTLRSWQYGRLDDPDARIGTSVLDAGGYAVVFDWEYTDFRSEQPYDLAAGTLVLGVHAGDLFTSGLSTTEPVTLYFPSGTLNSDVASTFGRPVPSDDPFERDASAPGFPFDPGEGRSLERVSFDADDGLSGWVRSAAFSGRTPGSVNSTVPVARDLDCSLLRATNPAPDPFEDLGLVVSIACAGTTSVEGATLELYVDEDLDGLMDAGELLAGPVEIPSLAPGENLEIELAGGLAEGRWRLVAEVSPDDRPTNDRAVADVAVGDVETDLVVNEFLSRPTDNQPEWIELYNPSAQNVQLEGWSFGDDADRGAVLSFEESRLLVPPGGFLVLTQDLDKMRTAYPLVDATILEPDDWETLNNTDDVITLADDEGFVVERVPYDDDWAGERDLEDGVSWERVSPEGRSDAADNWWLSVDSSGSTPGEANSLGGGFSRAVSLSVSPDPFSPDGDGFHDVAVIRYEVPLKSLLTLRVFDSIGRPVRTLLEDEGATDGLLVWDGTGDDGDVLPVGMYILLAEARGERMERAKRAIVIARPLR